MYVIVSLHVCHGDLFLFWIAVWPFCLEESVRLAFCLWCFDCGAVTLSASFFPFGVLKLKVLGNCIDS